MFSLHVDSMYLCLHVPMTRCCGVYVCIKLGILLCVHEFVSAAAQICVVASVFIRG